MSTVERAIGVAAEAHRGQTTRLGEPYVLHPLRVMLRVRGDAERQVAALHDVVERTDWTLERLREEGFSDAVLSAVAALTRRAGEDYFDFVRRASADRLARTVKKADLLDNSTEARRGGPARQNRERLAKYETALRMLGEDGGAGDVAVDAVPPAERPPASDGRSPESRTLLYLPTPAVVRMQALSLIRRVRQAYRSFSQTGDVESLHDLRVAMRKLRSLFRAYGRDLKGSVRAKDRNQLRALAAATRTLRELDVRFAWVAEMVLDGAEAAAAERLRAQTAEARDDEIGSVQDRLDGLGKLLRRLRKRLRRYTLKLDTGQSAVGPPFAVALADTVMRLRHQLSEALERAAEADESRIHAARITAKRLRYALEPVADTPAGAAALAELVGLQELLGRYKDFGDAIVTMDRELASAHRAASEALVAGLQGLLSRARRERARLLEQTRAAWLEDGGRRRLCGLDIVVADVLTAAGTFGPVAE